MQKNLKVTQTLNIFENFQNCGISRHKFSVSDKSEHLKLYGLKSILKPSKIS